MATLKEIINRIVARNDGTYSWPDHSCAQPVIDFAREVVDRDFNIHYIMRYREALAAACVMRDFEGRWFLPLKETIIDNRIGWEVEHSDLQTGDIIEFTNPSIRFHPESESGIGIMYNDEWFYSKGFQSVLPLPVSSSKILTVMRLDICPKLSL